MGYILIVDDNSSDIEILRVLLNSEGYSVKSSVKANDAYKLIDVSLPDLILLDISMPDMDGFEVCKYLKSKDLTKDTPIIFLTGHTDYEMKKRAFEAGAQDYITKPIHSGETLARIRSQLYIQESFRRIQEYHEQETRYLKRLLEIKTDFIATTTHDLKNPLSIVSNSIYMIRKFGREDWSLVFRHVDTIEHALNTMKQLVTSVLDLAQSESEPLDIQDVDIIESIMNAIFNVRLLAEKKDITIVFTEPPGTFLIKVDKVQISRIIVNILSNAIKYSPPYSQVFVEINADLLNQHINIYIRDEGYGIPKDDLDKIFDRFYRAHTIQQLDEGGTGLGLSIVKSLMERNNGDVKVISQLGSGSTFILTFPL